MDLKQILSEENNFTFKSKNFCLKKLVNKYIAKLELELDKEIFTYLGGINLNFERNELGIYKYHNGDIYLGNWNRNCKDGLGIFFSIQVFPGSSDKTFYNLYMGNWTGNCKNGNGIYLRILLNKDFKNLNNTAKEETNENNNKEIINNDSSSDNSFISKNSKNFTAKDTNLFFLNNKHFEKFEIFCGNFKDDEFIEGINYFVSENNEETIYLGKMNENYEKNDSEGIFVTRHNKYVYKGKFVDNKFINGFVFNANDENNKLFYIEYEDHEIIDYKNKNYIDNYDELYFNMIKIYVYFNEIDIFHEIIKFANLTENYITQLIKFDFEIFIEKYDFLREHVLYIKELFNNTMDSLSLE